MVKRKKYFSKLVDCYLIEWINVGTWYTGHPYDMERFYKFIHALKRFSKKEICAKDVENRIKEAVTNGHGGFNKEELNRIAKEFSIIAIHCLDCLKTWINPPYDFKDCKDKFMKHIKRNG